MKLARTLILTLALAGSAYAGNMQNGSPEPPPQQAQSTEPVTTPDTQVTTETAEVTPQSPTVTEVILTVVSVLGLI